MPKIGMLGTGCDDEIIVGNAAAFRDHFSACRIDPRNESPWRSVADGGCGLETQYHQATGRRSRLGIATTDGSCGDRQW